MSTSKEEHYEKGMEHFSEDRMDQAIEELYRALKIDPAYGDALHALAMTYYHQGDIDNAIKYGERYREADPSEALAYTSLSMFYNAKGMIEKAEEMGAKANAPPAQK
ncbi:MAG: tetratricopeptide repeat protein [Acidobacteriota bacterium]